MGDKGIGELIQIAKEEAWYEGYWDGVLDATANFGRKLGDWADTHQNPYES